MGQRFTWVLFACLCNSSWMPFHPGPFKGCYSEAWSRRNIKTSFPNGCSSIFLVESIEGWSKKQDKTSKQTVRSSDKSEWTIEAKAYITRRYGAYTSASWLWNWLVVNAEEQFEMKYGKSKVLICVVMGFIRIFWKEQLPRGLLAKN